MRDTRNGAAWGVIPALFLLVATPGLAQDRLSGSRLVPVDDWTYEYVQRLRVRGYLPTLNPLVQPYRRMDIARGVAQLDPDTLPRAVGEWARLLQDELAPELHRLGGGVPQFWGLEFLVGGRASTSQRLDPLRPVGEEDAWPRFTAGAWVETGPVAAESRLAGDVFLTYDPDGLDPGQIRGGRADHAYVSLNGRVGSVTLGRFKQSWAALGSTGLMVSDVATPYPQLAIELRAGPIAFRSFTGELDALFGTKRHIAAHRLDYQRENLVLSFGESLIYSSQGAFLSLRYLNPLEFHFFDVGNEPKDIQTNQLLEVQAWHRRGPAAFWLHFMLDDMDVIPGERDPEPLLYGFTVGSRVAPRAAPWELSLEYRQVAAFAYRTPLVIDEYSFLRRGLGARFSDYDQLTLAVDFFPAVPGLILGPAVQVLRQGEGDFRDSIPPLAEYLASRTLFLGTTERTFRVGLRGRYQPNRYLWLAWDLGPDFIRNAGHVLDVSRSEFAAVAELGVMFDLPIRRRR